MRCYCGGCSTCNRYKVRGTGICRECECVPCPVNGKGNCNECHWRPENKIITDLQLCPFCGGKAETVYAAYDYNAWGVQCKECGAYVAVGVGTGTADTEKSAIEAWNRRVTDES